MKPRPLAPSRAPHFIELLEARIAPASVFRYVDIDGDKVTIASSTGDLAAAGVVNVLGGVLRLLDLSGGGFAGANLTFSVARVPGGDGLANVGYINSTGHDLGNVVVKGDLGQIDAGDAATATTGLKMLSVRSLGRLGTDTQGGGDLLSDITGALGSLTVAGDVKDAFIEVTGGADGTIGAITIGGSVIGGANVLSGAILAAGDVGAVKIGHHIQGGSGTVSGFIGSNSGKIASVSIGGSLIGGSGIKSGHISSGGDLGAVKIGHNLQGGTGAGSAFIATTGKLAGLSIGGSLIGGAGSFGGAVSTSGDIGTVKIAHDVLGGSGKEAGFIETGGKLAGLKIGGSLIGGSAREAGAILTSGDIGTVKIGHDVLGGSITGSASLNRSGSITSGGAIASITVGGSIISGTDSSTGSLGENASIRAGDDLGALTVRGSLVGNVTADGASPVVISARGQSVPSGTSDVAIGRISIGGNAEFANFLAGYTTNLIADNGDAQIGVVKVRGDWLASNLVAGAQNAASGNTNFGDANDAPIGAGSGSIISAIARITINGAVFGSPTSVSSSDHFGFVAEQIGAVMIGGSAIVLAADPHNDNIAAGATGDVTIHEV